MRIETDEDKEYSYYDEVLRKVAVSDYANNPIYKRRLYASFVQSCHDQLGDKISNLIYRIIAKYDLDKGVLNENMEQLIDIVIHHISKNEIFMKDYVNRHPECIRELLDERVKDKKDREMKKAKKRKEQVEFQKKQYAMLHSNKSQYDIKDIEKIKSFEDIDDMENDMENEME